MEEKKLTDEEIVKALECCIASPIGCDECPLIQGDEAHCSWILDVALDLIHRLQGYVERLKEVNAGLALANLYDLPPNEDCLTDNEFEVARKTIAEQKAEIERLMREVDKQKNFVTAWEESWKIANEQNTKIRVKLKKENTEIQKQVDELKARDMSEMRDLFKAETDRLIEKAHQQAVKVTAKEILQELYDQIDENTPKWVGVQIKIIAKRKGVEVE